MSQHKPPKRTQPSFALAQKKKIAAAAYFESKTHQHSLFAPDKFSVMAPQTNFIRKKCKQLVEILTSCLILGGFREKDILEKRWLQIANLLREGTNVNQEETVSINPQVKITVGDIAILFDKKLLETLFVYGLSPVLINNQGVIHSPLRQHAVQMYERDPTGGLRENILLIEGAYRLWEINQAKLKLKMPPFKIEFNFDKEKGAVITTYPFKPNFRIISELKSISLLTPEEKSNLAFLYKKTFDKKDPAIVNAEYAKDIEENIELLKYVELHYAEINGKKVLPPIGYYIFGIISYNDFPNVHGHYVAAGFMERDYRQFGIGPSFALDRNAFALFHLYQKSFVPISRDATSIPGYKSPLHETTHIPKQQSGFATLVAQKTFRIIKGGNPKILTNKAGYFVYQNSGVMVNPGQIEDRKSDNPADKMVPEFFDRELAGNCPMLGFVTDELAGIYRTNAAQKLGLDFDNAISQFAYCFGQMLGAPPYDPSNFKGYPQSDSLFWEGRIILADNEKLALVEETNQRDVDPTNPQPKSKL